MLITLRAWRGACLSDPAVDHDLPPAPPQTFPAPLSPGADVIVSVVAGINNGYFLTNTGKLYACGCKLHCPVAVCRSAFSPWPHC